MMLCFCLWLLRYCLSWRSAYFVAVSNELWQPHGAYADTPWARVVVLQAANNSNEATSRLKPNAHE